MSKLKLLIDRLMVEYPRLSPQLKKAAKRVLEAPTEVAINSMRQVAAQAEVAPSTMLRLAKVMDFASYEAFRLPFRESIRERGDGFGNRAQWLQELSGSGDSGALLSNLARANLDNVASAFQDNDPETFSRAAAHIRGARHVYVVGAGGGYSLAHYFFYVGRMALPNLRAVYPFSGSPIDDLIDLGPSDAVVAVTFRPYTTATVLAAQFACERGANLIAISDSRTSPLATGSACLLLTPTASPQFFPSYTAATAVMEALIAFIVAGGDQRTVAKIADTERFRYEANIYWDESQST